MNSQPNEVNKKSDAQNNIIELNPNINFMLVEDDEVDIMNITRAFKKNNITNNMYIARDGQESLDMLYGTDETPRIDPLPKIILLDINMPRMNGLEFLARIRKDDRLKSMLVYIMSTSNEPNDIKEAYENNVAGYILKPIKFHNFVEEVAVMKQFWSMLQI